MELVGADQKALAQAAVGHHTDDFQTGAAVAGPFSARIASPTVHVRFNAAGIPLSHVLNSIPYLEDFNAEFVAGDSGESKKRKLAQITAYIRSTDSHPMGSHKSLARARGSGSIDQDLSQFLRFNDLDCAHRLVGYSED